MLSHYFKKEVVFNVSENREWTTISYFTPLLKWKEMLKDAICSMCAESLNFDDYLIGPSQPVQKINIHAEILETFTDFLINRHGFTQDHPVKDQDLLKHFPNNSIYSKRLTEKQFDAFLKDLEKLEIVPSMVDLKTSNPGVFESHIKRFDNF